MCVHLPIPHNMTAPAGNDQPRLALGIGCDRDTPVATLALAVSAALARIGASSDQVTVIATIDIKADESGLRQLTKACGWPLRLFTAEHLASVTVPNPSEAVRRHTGTPSVSAAAALLAADCPLDGLLVEKHRERDADGKHATVSIASIART